MIRGATIRPAELWRITLAFVRLDAIEDLNYPLHIVMRYLGLMFPVFIQFFVARLVRPGQSEHLGSDYFTFAVVGMVVAGVVQFGLTGFGFRLQYAMERGTLETLLVEPVPWTFVPIAMNVWHILSGALAGTILLLTGVALGAHFDWRGVPAFILITGLGIGATASIGILSASVLVLAKRSQPIISLYGLAASLVGGALFPIEFLPPWLRAVSYLVPHTYVISGGRKAIMAQPPDDGISITTAIAALAVFDVIVLVVGILTFSRALHYARQEGLLGSY